MSLFKELCQILSGSTGDSSFFKIGYSTEDILQGQVKEDP
jgi:hypothetical protein